MEKISLYDQSNDKIYDVMLSVEDARRAASGEIKSLNHIIITIQ